MRIKENRCDICGKTVRSNYTRFRGIRHKTFCVESFKSFVSFDICDDCKKALVKLVNTERKSES